MARSKWPGTWRVICDVCGFEYASDQVRKRWDGLIVCDRDYEERHPQTLYNYKHHISVPAFIRGEPEDSFVFFCAIDHQSGYAGLAAADCARAGNTMYSYDFLFGLSGNGHT